MSVHEEKINPGCKDGSPLEVTVKGLKIVGIIALMVLSCLIVFAGGVAVGKRNSLSAFVKESAKYDARIELGNYTIYRDVASSLREGDYKDAKCRSDLAASSMFDNLKQCMSENDCRGAIESLAREQAPELVGRGEIKFNYIKSLHGGKHCD